MNTKLKNFITKHQIAIVSIILFTIIFSTLGLPFTQWGFKTDDWGNVYHSIIKSWHDFFNFFTEGNSECVMHPSNVSHMEQAFFQGLYRPMSFIYYYIQYCFFGTAPYGYHLASVAIHACNSVLLFLLFSRFCPITTACIGAVFFGFHPSLYNWIGWTSAQTYFIELCSLLLIIILLLKYLETKRLLFYVIACILFLANLFLKEQTIFLPFWLFFAFHCYYTTQNNHQVFFKNISHYVALSSGFWLISFFYLGTRLHFFPLTKHTGTLTFEPTWHSFITRMSHRLYDFVSYANDMIGLSWISQGHSSLKTLLMLLFFITCIVLFIVNTRKSLVLFCLCSIPLFSWPALLMHYQPRYMYMALPLVITTMLILICYAITPIKMFINRYGSYITILCASLIIFHACFLYQQLRAREKILHTITVAFKTLVDNPRTYNRPICFLALPQWFAGGCAQAVWMYRNNKSMPVCEYCVHMEPLNGDLPKNYVHFKHLKNEFVCTSNNSNKFWFIDAHGNKTSTATIIIENHYMQQNPVYVVWDYEQQTFRILDY